MRRKLSFKKLFIFLVFLACLIGLFFAVPMMKEEKQSAAGKSDSSTTSSESESKKDSDSSGKSSFWNSKNKDVENIAVKGEVDNWSGWFGLINANGGNQTTSNSYFGKSGLDVTITPVNSDEEKLQHLINGDIDFTACTINRLALISGDLSVSDTAVVVPLLTDASSGGDGIVVRDEFTSIESLKDATIGVGEGSVSHALVVWAIQQTDLSDEDKYQIIDNIKTYPSASDAKDAYLKGEVNALSTWQPYIDETIAAGGSHVLLSTKTSSSLVMDALFFRKDFADEHPEIVEAMVDGILSVVEDMKAGTNSEEYCEVFRKSLPDFAESSDEEILTMLNESTLLDWHQNVDAFENTAHSMFVDMCAVWESIGNETYSNFGDNIFDDSYIQNLSSKYKNTEKTNNDGVSVTDENKQQIIDAAALLTKTATVEFQPQVTLYMDETEATAILDEFVKIAKILDGAIIQIEGNVSSRKTTDDQRDLSLNRANKIKEYFVSQGIDENRIITIGNGGDKPIYSDPQEDYEYRANRRVDVFFKVVEEY